MYSIALIQLLICEVASLSFILMGLTLWNYAAPQIRDLEFILISLIHDVLDIMYVMSMVN